ncbi:putative phage cell wall peptidase, NlpC/P60 family [Paracoccus halophilus]|uniref:Peptidase n=1 Tax=Paracoccus halophilus TaxID=376733 RepID=A0A099F3Q7_9RHOB|nr:NlpC/P60 family protein [Paracoccus halophilus]KGJ04822.1 peptidase [Paracoccus halophilus]SFA51371.1 putative phage cell wall peptidase, NlpC/P60 family [Paracoccus halophilus]
MSVAIVQAARGWIGTPYVHQASVRGAGMDCLGLVRGVWREIVGAEPEPMPAYTPDWGEAGGAELLLGGAGRLLHPAPDEQPGDVLVFRMRAGAIAKHLGILAQTGAQASFVHAYDRHGVVESPLSAPWRARIAGRFRFPPVN